MGVQEKLLPFPRRKTNNKDRNIIAIRPKEGDRKKNR